MYDCLQGSIQAFLLCIPMLDVVVGTKLKGDQHDCKVYSKTTHKHLAIYLIDLVKISSYNQMAFYTPGRILVHQHEDASTSRMVPCI
jgi:hypothetical protein